MREINQSGGVEVRVVYALLTLELIGKSSRYEGGGVRFGGVKVVGGERTLVGVILI